MLFLFHFKRDIMANTTGAIEPKDLPSVNTCNVGDLLVLNVFTTPGNTETRRLVSITVNNFVNSIISLLP